MRASSLTTSHELPCNLPSLVKPSLTSTESTEHSELVPLIPVNSSKRNEMYRSAGASMRQTQSENAGNDSGKFGDRITPLSPVISPPQPVKENHRKRLTFPLATTTKKTFNVHTFITGAYYLFIVVLLHLHIPGSYKLPGQVIAIEIVKFFKMNNV